MFGTGTPGYDGSAAAAKDVLLEVARAMLEDENRYGFCVTPTASEVDYGPAGDGTSVTAPALVASGAAPGFSRNDHVEPRNKYFHAICQTMAASLAQQVKTVEVRNRLKEKCLANPKYLPACQTLTW